MPSVITIYFLIGLAYWASHLLQCAECQRTLLSNVVITLEGITHVLGWPLQAVSYFSNWTGGQKRKIVELEIDRLPGETTEDFLMRALTKLRKEALNEKSTP